MKAKPDLFIRDLTNGELVRNLTNEYLAEFMEIQAEDACQFCDFVAPRTRDCKKPRGKSCKEGYLAWLTRKPKRNESACIRGRGNKDFDSWVNVSYKGCHIDYEGE
jgi:hypothetical protein